MPHRPGWIAPMLASEDARLLPTDLTDWAAEVKWDGMRVIVHLDAQGHVHAYSRTGADASVRYPELGHLAELTQEFPLVLDGEVVALNAKGLPDFGRLQQRMTLRRDLAVRQVMGKVPVTLMTFDVLQHRGRDTTLLPWAERRALLESLELDRGAIRTPPAWEGAVQAGIGWARERGLEGVIAKRISATYQPGARSRSWVKIKFRPSITVVVGGWDADARGEIRSLLVGTLEADGLRYVGSVGSGLSAAQRRLLAPLFAEAATSANPFTEQAPPERRFRYWLLPLLVGEIEYAEITHGGHLRQPSWKGLRGLAGEQPG